MRKSTWSPILGLVAALVTASFAKGQSTPYIGFVYPAGGQQGTTVEVRLGGQLIDGLHSAVVSGEGVRAEVADFYRKLGNQEMSLLREQFKQLRREAAQKIEANQKVDEETEEFIARLQKRIDHWVNRPACSALSSIAILKITIAPNAKPGTREIRLIGSRGITNPMVFHVGQLPEYTREPMVTSSLQVLGKEALAQRKRPPEQAEQRIELPCTVNGQIASGEVNRYHFQARKGQRLVISAKARDLVPYIADAVPGWFQPVMVIHDSSGTEVAFNDDYRFKPDPTLLLEVPTDGDYVLTIADAIYRGREDFVYRITIGELPFLTSIFPLGGSVGEPVDILMKGWNLQQSKLSLPSQDAQEGVYQVNATNNQELVTNTLPLALDTLPEFTEQEPNNYPVKAQAVELPGIINGRIDRPDDWDVFEFSGTAGETIVAEIHARRLDSPLDSILKVTDSKDQLLVFNDDHFDAGSGLNTHHADSYVTVTFPKDGQYFLHVGDTTQDGGDAFAYRLRLSSLRPDFALRVVPSSINLRSRSGVRVTVYAIRRDGFDGPIRLAVEDLPIGFTSTPVTLKATEQSARIVIKAKPQNTKQAIALTVVGRAEIADREVAHPATPAEDRMQAFLWRHLVPAENLVALVLDPSDRPLPTRPRPPKLELTELPDEPVKFSQKQVAGRLRQLGLLFDEWLLTDDFYNRKVAQCEVFEATGALKKKK